MPGDFPEKTVAGPSDPDGRDALAQTRHGVMKYNRNDSVVGRSLEYYGEYFEQEVALFRQCLRPGDTAIDVGANIGAHTVPLARLVGPGGRVTAFEPVWQNYRLLQANLAMNGLDWVEGLHAAAGARDDTLRLGDVSMEGEGNYGALSLEALPGDRPVPLHRLDSVIRHERVRLIKIDVEGMEAEVLEGARALIARTRPALYVENDRPEKSRALILRLQELGYACHWYLPAFHNPANANGRTEPLFETGFVDNGVRIHALGMGINLFCIPAEQGGRIAGLPAVADPDEHPLHRDRNARFVTPKA